MKKKFLQCVFAAAFCLSGGVFVASCDDVIIRWITLRLTEKQPM